MSLIIPKEDMFLCGPEIYLPEMVDNQELLRRLGYGDGIQTRLAWIEARSGIKKRPWVQADKACSDLAIEAGKELLKKHPAKKEKIKHLILSTISGDYNSPPTSPLIQTGLGLPEIGSYDIASACAGFATALYPAVCQSLATSEDQLVICSEIRSKFLNPKDLTTAILFGDGAGACIVSKEREDARFKIRAVMMKSNGKYHDLIKVPAGGSRSPAATEESKDQFYISMGQGAAVFLSALEAMVSIGKGLVEACGVKLSDLAWLVPHQANKMLINEVAKQLGVAAERVIFTIEETGNISSASSIIALHSLVEKHELKKGELVLNVSAGGGGFAAGCLLEVI